MNQEYINFETIIDILKWAVQQGHINDEQMDLIAREIHSAVKK